MTDELNKCPECGERLHVECDSCSYEAAVPDCQAAIDSLMAERDGLLRMGEHQTKHLAKVIQERDEARTFIGLNITWLEDYYDAAKSNMSVKHSTEFLRWINACRKIDAAMRQEGE